MSSYSNTFWLPFSLLDSVQGNLGKNLSESIWAVTIYTQWRDDSCEDPRIKGYSNCIDQLRYYDPIQGEFDYNNIKYNWTIWLDIRTERRLLNRSLCDYSLTTQEYKPKWVETYRPRFPGLEMLVDWYSKHVIPDTKPCIYIDNDKYQNRTNTTFLIILPGFIVFRH